MATFTVTTPVNVDSLTGKTGGDIYNINGGALTIDQDSRYGLNQSTSATLGNVTLSATLGGQLTIDARYVRLIPYDGGAGTVPAAGTTISGASGSGTLIGVWSALNVAPTAAAAAMPASGYIKIKGWNSSAYVDNEALTGITANVNGTDVTGWIEIVGDDGSGITASRLNTVTTRGDYYLIGTTSGSNATTYQLPTSGSLIYGGGVFVDKTSSVNISSASWSGGTATINTGSAHGLTTGDQVIVSGVSPTAYNGDYYCTVVDSDTFTIEIESDPGTYSSGGAVVAIEYYANANGVAATAAAMATDVRGKVCWITTAGVVTFQNDGTNTTGGYLPASGLTIRIPNIILQGCATASRTANISPHATITTRYDYTTTGAAAIDVSHVWGTWYHSFTNPYSVKLNNSILVSRILIQNSVAPNEMMNVGVGCWNTTDATQTGALALVNCQQGGTYYNCVFNRSNHVANGYALNASDSLDHNFYDCQFSFLVTRTGTTNGSIVFQRCNDNTFIRPRLGVGVATLNTSAGNTFTDSILWSEPKGNTISANPYFAFILITTSTDNVISGISTLVPKNIPYSGLVSVGVGCLRNYIQSIGTYASRLDMGATEVYDATWTRVGTAITVTSVAHGLTTGDTIGIIIASDNNAFTTANKTVTVTGVDTFTVVGVNSGATSGTVSYFLTIGAYIYQISNASAADGLYLNKVYVKHLRSGLYTTDNSSKNIVMKDVYADPNAAPTFNANNITFLNSMSVPIVTGQSGVYGTHWWTALIAEPQGTTSATWTRVTTTATLTLTSHGQRASLGQLWVDASSDTAALTLAEKNVITNTGMVDSNNINVTCLNAGAASGTATVRVPNARIGIAMNEATTSTQDAYTFLGGNPQFTSTGALSMISVNDEIEFESPEIRGISEVLPYVPIMAGGTISNYDLFYSIDPLDGSGYAAEKNLYYRRTGGAITSGNAYLTVTDATGVGVGDYVFGTAIPAGAKVTSVDTGTNTVYIDITATSSSSSQAFLFNQIGNETLPATGFKMKLRIITTTANATAITSLYMNGRSSAADRLNSYPLTEANYSYELTNVVTGTEVILFDSTDTELDRQVLSGTTYTYNYTWNSDDGDSTGNYILLWKDDQVAQIIQGITLGDANQSVPVSQQEDLVYSTAATNATIDFANLRIQMDDTTDLSVPELYSLWKDQIRLTSNAQYEFAFNPVGGNLIAGATSIPDYIFLSTNWTIRPFDDSYTLNVIDGIIVKDGGGDPFEDTENPQTVRINYQQPVQAITVSTGGGGGATASEVWSYSTRQLTGIGSSGIASEANATTNKNAIQTDITNLNDLSSADVTAAVPTEAEIASQVWSDTSVYTGTQKGKVLKDSADLAELASIK